MDKSRLIKFSGKTTEALAKTITEHKGVGYILDLDIDLYHKGPGISSSGLKHIMHCPRKYKYKLTEPQEKTDAMWIGNGVHCLVLEPHKFDDQYVLWKKQDKRTTEGKAAWAKFCKTHAGKKIFEQDDWDMITAIGQRMKAHKPFAKILSDGVKEVSFYAEADGGALCRARPDIYSPNTGVLTDIKTTQDVTEEAFAREVLNRNYHVQAAFHMDVIKTAGFHVSEFVFAAVEKEPPYEMALYYLDKKIIEHGRTIYLKALRTYAECVATDKWPGIPEKILPLNFPSWFMTQLERKEF
jgi:exodeoxyribonuclease VIII